jgi:hypothetical protein
MRGQVSSNPSDAMPDPSWGPAANCRLCVNADPLESDDDIAAASWRLSIRRQIIVTERLDVNMICDSRKN